MRVLIILALVGVACSELIATAPLASVIVDSTKPRYEYSSSVQTPTYNNFQYVRSAEEPKPTIIAARSDLPYYVSPYFAPNYYGSPFIRSTIPTSNIVLKSDYNAFPTTRLLPVPIAGERLLIKAAEPAVIPAAFATPTNIVRTIVEPKIVGEGLLERKSQYHSQNLLGEATYGHREPFQSHDAVQDAFGNKVGSFQYISADGRILQTDYVADANGYHVKSNALPVVEAVKSRKRRSVPTEENKEQTDEGKAPVEKRSLSLLTPSLLAPTVIQRSYVAPTILPHQTVVHSPLAYSPYAAYAPYSPYYAAPLYNAPLLRSPFLW